MDMIQISVALIAAVLATAVVLWWFQKVSPGVSSQSFEHGQGSVSFLFQQGELVDLSEEASLLVSAMRCPEKWSDILSLFKSRFDLPGAAFEFPIQEGQTLFRASDRSDSGLLEISRSGDRTRVEVINIGSLSIDEADRWSTLSHQLATLKEAVDATPVPIWKMSEDGLVTWHNPAYENLAVEVNQEHLHDSQSLFDLGETALAPGKIRRIQLDILGQNSKNRWFDIHCTKGELGDFYSALDADAIVRAEVAQRNFVQTLAKTFAHLPIGLAIFDGNRQLMLFNPALVDLTGLGAEFLSSRPNLASFFDELRDRNMMPEPKNYSSWRQQIADLVAAASDGRYSETWTLPNNRTYRINGRPHPDGAIAFLIEDISAEVSLTRSFRAELELGQSVVDGIDCAIAVFSATGVLTMTNESYRKLWRVDPDGAFAEFTILECLRDWRDRCRPSPVLGELRDFVLDVNERSAFNACVTLSTGQVLDVATMPLVSGSSMIKFSAQPGNFLQDTLDTSLSSPLQT